LAQEQNVSETTLFAFSADTNIINSGVMFFKRSDLTMKFIDEIIAIGPTPGLGMG